MMKKFNPHNSLLLVFVSLWMVFVAMISITGCGEDDDDDDNEWIGTWTLETVDGQSAEEAFLEPFENAEEIDLDPSASITNEWIFDSDGMMEAEITVKFEVKGEGLDFSGEGSMRITGTYAISGSNFTITYTDGELTGVFKNVFSVDEIVGTEFTGTWSRKGNTLTLNGDHGVVSVYKKR